LLIYRGNKIFNPINNPINHPLTNPLTNPLKAAKRSAQLKANFEAKVEVLEYDRKQGIIDALADLGYKHLTHSIVSYYLYYMTLFLSNPTIKNSITI